MPLDQFIAGALPEPTGGIALLILIIYLVTFLLQRLIGERLPNEGEISTIALSLTAFVLSLYMLIAAWQTKNESIYSLGIARGLEGILSKDGVPLIASVGIYLSPLIAILTTLFTFVHFLMLIGLSVQLTDRDYFAQIMANCTLFILAVMMAIFSPDLPFIFLAICIGHLSLYRLANIFYKPVDSSIDVIFQKLSNFTIIALICVVFIKYRVWHEDIFRSIQLHFPLGEINLSLKETISLSRQVSPIGFGILIVTLISAFFIKSGLRSLRLFQYISENRAGNTVLWVYSVIWSSIGLFLLLRWGKYLPNNIKEIFVIIGLLVSLWGLRGVLKTWKIHHFFMMFLLIKAGFVMILVGLGQQTLGFLMLVSLITTSVLVFAIASILSAPLRDFFQEHGLTIYHPEEDAKEKISPGDIRYMRGLRKNYPFIFWMFSFTLAALVGTPLTIQFTSFIEFFNYLSTSMEILHISILICVLFISLASFWGIGRYWGLLISGENILNRIQMSKNIRPSIWSTPTEIKTPPVTWRVWIVILLLGLLNLFFWLGANPFSIEGSWIWELFLETSSPPIYWLHFMWFSVGICIFIFAANRFRNKSTVNLLKK